MKFRAGRSQTARRSVSGGQEPQSQQECQSQSQPQPQQEPQPQPEQESQSKPTLWLQQRRGSSRHGGGLKEAFEEEGAALDAGEEA